jgi:ATP-dependent RNA helicase DDX5/DBP2
MQIAEIRSRLNIDVSVASGSPLAPAAIESFEDMVNSFSFLIF